MSDVAYGPGWWIASDGKWYAPELHPSNRNNGSTDSPVTNGSVASRLAMHAHNDSGHVGPSFPDLFEKAVQGTSLADAVTWKNDDGTHPVQQAHVVSQNNGHAGGASSGSVTISAPSKKKWRKG